MADVPHMMIIESRFYPDIADELVKGATEVLAEAGATYKRFEVPGALEIPTAIGIAARLGEFQAFVALGCVIRGETTHYDTVVNESSHGLTLLGLQGHCIGNGILTVENAEQARVRAEASGQNKGGDAAAAALHLLQLSRRWARAEKGVGFLQGRLGGAA